MGDLVERLKKYIPLSSASEAKGMGDFPSECAAGPVGIIMWNLIVNDVVNTVTRSDSSEKLFTDSDIKARRKNLFDELDELIVLSRKSNLTPAQVSDKLSDTVVSIARKHLEQCTVGHQMAWEPKKQLDFAEQEHSSVRVTKAIVDCLPYVMKASRCQLENDGEFIEALMTPLGAKLVTDEKNGPEKMLGFRIWAFVIRNSNSAVRNHGYHFVPLMIKYGEWFHYLPFKTKSSSEEITAEQHAMYTDILREIVLGVQAMAVQENLSDSIMNLPKTNICGRVTSYFKELFYSSGGCASYYQQYIDTAHPLAEELLVAHFTLCESHKIGGLHELARVAWSLNAASQAGWYPDGKNFNPDLLKCLFGRFMNLTMSYIQDEWIISEELPAEVIEFLRRLSSAVFRYNSSKIRDDLTVDSLFEKFGNILDVYVEKIVLYLTTNIDHKLAYNVGRSVNLLLHISEKYVQLVKDPLTEAVLATRLQKLHQAALVNRWCKCYHAGVYGHCGFVHHFFSNLLNRKDTLPFTSKRELWSDFMDARRRGTADHYETMFAHAPRKCESVKRN